MHYQPPIREVLTLTTIRHRLWLSTRLFGVDYENCSPIFEVDPALHPPSYLAWDR